MAGRSWSRSETLAAFALYCQLPFGKLHSGNREVIALASRLGRTLGSVAMKCVNLASLDETHQKRGVRGMQNVSKMDRTIWFEFMANPEEVSLEASLAFETPFSDQPLTSLNESDFYEDTSFPIVEGKERERLDRVRVNQRFFRRLVMASYNESCCVCGVPLPELLVASHIVPWSIDESLRMNPRNGLCLCGTHDLAYESGILRIEKTFTIRVFVPRKHHSMTSINDWFLKFEGELIQMPTRWLPNPDLLQRKWKLVTSEFKANRTYAVGSEYALRFR